MTMTTETLQRIIDATPFRPFVIRTADSREILVPHPDFIAQAPDTRTVMVSQSDNSFEVIDLSLIDSLKVIQPETSAH
jgi:hypothetical protein